MHYFSSFIVYDLTWPDLKKMFYLRELETLKHRTIEGRGLRGGLDEKMRIWLGREIVVGGLSPLVWFCEKIYTRGGHFMYVCLYQNIVCNTEPKACTGCRYLQYIRFSVFIQSRREHLFILNCLLKDKFNIHVIYCLYI